jgi:TonB family protein
MQLTLLESDRSFLRSAECIALSIVAHLTVVWLAVASTTGGRLLPETERDARVFFLLPPDRVDVGERQVDIPHAGKLGSGLGEAQAPDLGEGLRAQAAATHARRKGERSGPRVDLPVSPTPYVPDSVYSVLQVDQMVERFESSAAPVYPPELARRGTEGKVEATYVVDTAGRVDTSTFHVLQSDDSLFTESVRTALADMQFRPAKRGGKTVRQLVAQRFRFRLAQQARPVDGSW